MVKEVNNNYFTQKKDSNEYKTLNLKHFFAAYL